MSIDIKKLVTLQCPLPLWLRRLGIAGFLFFLVKGLLWLVLIGLLYSGILINL